LLQVKPCQSIDLDADSAFHLLSIAQDPAFNINVRMMATLTLKNNFDKLFPLIQDKNGFTQLAFSLLKQEAPAKLKDVASFVMAKLIHCDAMEGDYFDQELFGYWVGQLSSPDSNEIKIALTVISGTKEYESSSKSF
jgi:hypothetical protein